MLHIFHHVAFFLACLFSSEAFLAFVEVSKFSNIFSIKKSNRFLSLFSSSLVFFENNARGASTQRCFDCLRPLQIAGIVGFAISYENFQTFSCENETCFYLHFSLNVLLLMSSDRIRALAILIWLLAVLSIASTWGLRFNPNIANYLNERCSGFPVRPKNETGFRFLSGPSAAEQKNFQPESGKVLPSFSSIILYFGTLLENQKEVRLSSKIRPPENRVLRYSLSQCLPLAGRW